MIRPRNKRAARLLLLGLIFAAGQATAEVLARCYDSTAPDVIRSETLAVGTLNISHGRGTALNQLMVSSKRTAQNLDAIARLLDDEALDIVALQEADAPSRWSGNFDHVRYLTDSSALLCTTHGRHARGWLYSYGTAIMSRYRPEWSDSVIFEPTPPTARKGFVRDDYRWQTNGRELTVSVVSVHLDFSRKSAREDQVNQLISELQDVEGELILMGDINSEWLERNSHVQQLAQGLQLRAFNPDAEGLGTYKSESGSRLDWILVSSGLEFEGYRTLPDVVSDHFLVRADVRLAAK